MPGQAGWRSTEYTVTVTDLSDGSLHLSISRYGTRGRIRNWRHLQAIKNTLAGPDREALEIFPSEDRLVDAADQYHLWVLPEGQLIPYGYANRDVGGPTAAAATGGRQTPFEPGTEPPEGVDPPASEVRTGFLGPHPTYLDAPPEEIAAAKQRMRDHYQRRGLTPPDALNDDG